MSKQTQNQEDIETFLPEGVKVKLTRANTEFVIQEFVFKQRTEVLRLLSETFQEVLNSGVELIPANNTLVAMKVIHSAGEKLGKVYATVLEKDQEWIGDNITIKDEIEIINAILQVNDLPFLMRQIQEMVKKNTPVPQEKKKS